MSSPVGEYWHIFAEGTHKGPYQLEELRRLLQTGSIPDDALFSCGVSSPWLTRAQFGSRIAEPEVEAAPSEAGDSSEASPGHEQPEASPSHAAEPEPPESEAKAADSADEGIPAAALPRRDRIVVIGRRSAGKTVYLATLYHHLWKSRDGLSMKALSGRVHRELVRTYDALCRGQWPVATSSKVLSHLEFETEYRSHKRILVGLEYGGEVFRDVFVNDDTSSDQAITLLSHIDRALAVILLVDPALAANGNADAFIDDDYGIVQSIQRIRDWPSGEQVPVVMLLTKADQNQHLFSGKESTRQFITTHYAALMRTLTHFKVFHASAFQARKDKAGKLVPLPESVPANIIESLRHCLDKLEEQRERECIAADQEERQRAFENMVGAQQEAERDFWKKFKLTIISLVVIVICIIVLILLLKV